MREYMPKVGSMGLDMMFRTCTVQVNLDFSSEEDMVKKFRVGLALQVPPRAHVMPGRARADAQRRRTARSDGSFRQLAVRGRQAVRFCKLSQQRLVCRVWCPHRSSR